MMRKILCGMIMMMTFAVSVSYGAGKKADIDLSKLNGMMAYSGLFNVMCNPSAYEGKIIKLKGYCETVHDETTGKDYYGVILMDGSMCCSVGVDFVLKPSYKYPKSGAVITVMGRFEQYKDGEDTFCRLSDAELL